jgi:hypothetical protein
MKKGFLLAGLVTGVIVAPGIILSKKHNSNNQKANVALAFAEAYAAETKPTDECLTAFQSALDGAPKNTDWTNQVLLHLHEELYRFNSVQTADIEMVFCRLSKVMGVTPDLTNLPQTVTKTDPRGGTFSVTVSAPTETWATTAGYIAKAEMKSDDVTFMTLWWSGSDSSSKGYLIQGANPMQKDGNKRLRYAQWDRTGTIQSMKMMGAQFSTGFLTTAAGSTESKTGGDQAIFGRMTYDTSSKAVTSQQVEIRDDKKSPGTFKCVRTYFTGVLGGSIDGYRPAQGTPEAVSETSTGGVSAGGGLGMDGEKGLADLPTTADHGTASPGSTLASGTFDYSCADMNGAGATGKPFAGNTVSFTADSTTIFPK